MTAYLQIRNWDRYQHYKSRNPPWIKLYNSLLDDYEFSRLHDASKAHLIGIWMLASRHGGQVPYDAEWIAHKINATETVDIEPLLEGEWLVPIDKTRKQNASAPRASRKQLATPERERERYRKEGKVEKEVSLRSTRARAQGNGAEKPGSVQTPQRVAAVYELAFAAGWEAWRAVDMGKGSRFAAREAWRKLIEKPKLDPRPVVEAVSAYCLQCASTASKTQHMVTWIRQRGWETPYDEGVLTKENAIVGKHRHELALAWEKAYNAEVPMLEDQNEEIEP